MSDPLVTPDLAGRFNRIRMNEEAEKLSMKVSPLFLAYLQNKIAAYAEDLVESKLTYHADPTQQVAAIVEHERKQATLDAYVELMSELVQANNPDNQPNQPE